MTTRYAVTRTINASPDRVWSVLTDGDTFADWNDSIVSFEGPIELGKKVKLVSVVNPKRAFSLLVSAFEPPGRMVWEDGMPLGLFKGVRTYTVTPAGEGAEFSMVEEYSGPLAGLMTRMIPDMTESFDLFADSLKRTAESAG